MIWTERLIEANFGESMTARNHLKPNCAETLERLDTELNLTDSRLNDAIREHIKTCNGCAEIWKQNLRVRKNLQQAVKREAAPDGLFEKIQAMFKSNVI